MNRIRIAHFSPMRAWAYVVLGLAICAWLFAIYAPRPGLPWFSTLGRNRFDDYYIFIGVILMPLLALMDLVVLRQLLFEQGDAIWLAEGILYFLDTYWGVMFSKVPVTDITGLSVKPATAFRSSAVIVTLKNGRRLSIPTLLLNDNADAIVARLAASGLCHA